MPRYPFTPELLDALPEELAELFRSLELHLLREICSRLKLSGQLNEVTVQAIRALRSHGIDLQDIENAVADTCGIGLETLDRLLDDVVEQNQKYYTNQIDLAQVTEPDRIVDNRDIEAIRRQTWSAYRNITGSMGFLAVQRGRLTLLSPAKAYQWALDQAEIQVQSGAFSYNQAIFEAVRRLADSGLKTVSYESGHVDSVDVAVRRAVMTGVNQLNQKYREQSMDYLETDLLEVTAHRGARDIDGPMGWENHKAWQGKVYRWKAKPRASKGDYHDFEDTCGYGSVTGIGGANCRHSYWPFIEGVSERTYTDEQLENIDPLPFEFEGHTYTAYQATQKQREIERTMRKLKRRRAALEAAGLEEDAEAAGIRLRRLTEKYRQFSEAAGLPEQWERTRMVFVDEDSQTNAAERLEKFAQSGILSDTGQSGIPITEEAIQRVPLVRPERWTEEQAVKLQDAHRELLQSVIDKPVGTEAGAIYSPDMKLLERRAGDDAMQQISMPRYDEPHILIHSHPSGGTFSHTDLQNFVFRENLMTMTAVGNNGQVYMLSKREQYDGFKTYIALNTELPVLEKFVESDDLQGYLSEIDSFIRELRSYGVEFIEDG